MIPIHFDHIRLEGIEVIDGHAREVASLSRIASASFIDPSHLRRFTPHPRSRRILGAGTAHQHRIAGLTAATEVIAVTSTFSLPHAGQLHGATKQSSRTRRKIGRTSAGARLVSDLPPCRGRNFQQKCPSLSGCLNE